MTRPRIDHIGVIVDDLDAAIGVFERLFKAPPSRVREMPDVGIRVAEFEAANLSVELIAYLNDGPGFGKRVMGETPGLNHLSARVDDIAAATAELSAAGFRPMAGFPRSGAHGTVVFFEPDETTGLLLEICGPSGEEAP